MSWPKNTKMPKGKSESLSGKARFRGGGGAPAYEQNHEYGTDESRWPQPQPPLDAGETDLGGTLAASLATSRCSGSERRDLPRKDAAKARNTSKSCHHSRGGCRKAGVCAGSTYTAGNN